MDKYQFLSRLPEALLPWYKVSRRDLPWRQDRDPYHIWVSEIMLQQTRVEAVKGYYTRFLTALPSIAALAECDEDQLHKLWEGLGYYSRARNLHKAAKIIREISEGRLKKVLFVPTGALLSKTSFNEGQSIPGIAHGVELVSCR